MSDHLGDCLDKLVESRHQRYDSNKKERASTKREQDRINKLGIWYTDISKWSTDRILKENNHGIYS